MKKISMYSLLALVLLLVIAYLGDYLILRIRIARGSGYGDVTVRQYYAINEKNSRTEYVYGSTEDQVCVNSIFGHQGLLPCWYLRRHPDQQVKI